MKHLPLLVALVASGAAYAAPLQITLTFDDNPKGQLTLAAPRLEANGWRGTFNIVTDWIAKNEKSMTWEDVRELKRRGHEIASHTVTHPHLRDWYAAGKTNELMREFVESRNIIWRETGDLPRFLCHPYVHVSPEIDALVRAAGMEPYAATRFGVGTGVSPQQLGAKLDAWIAAGVPRMDILFHGITAETGGWKPFASVRDFADCLDEIKKRETAGKLRVVSYDEFLNGPKAPPRVIFDSDCDGDYDDLGALAVLHGLADRGEAVVAACGSSTMSNASVAVFEIVNKHYGRADVPVCGLGPHAGLRAADGGFGLLEKYAGDYRYANSSAAPEASRLYRKLLAESRPGEITFCVVGYYTNLGWLLNSEPDDLSPLDGIALVREKKPRLVVMGCAYPSGRECNSSGDVSASARVFDDWPGEIVFSDFPLGRNVYTGRRVAEFPAARNPVADGFRNMLPAREKCTATSWDRAAGHPSWDEVTVLAAIRPHLFRTQRGRYRMVGRTGENVWEDDPSGPHLRLLPTLSDEETGCLIDDLMSPGIPADIASTRTIHVAPGAADGGDGTAAHPFSRIASAILLARQLHGRSDEREVTIRLHAGTYRPTEPIVFDESDSRITVKPFENDRVVISGGCPVTGFKPVADRSGVFVADVAACGYQGFERPLPSGCRESLRFSLNLRRENALFVNGRRLPLARWPNAEEAAIEEVVGNAGCVFRATLPEGLRLTRANSPDLMASGYFVYLWDREIVPAVVRDDGAFDLELGWPWQPPVRGQPFHLVNSLELLDAPGEWYLDRARGLLYVRPPAGVEVASAEWTLAEAAYPLVRIRGARHVRLEGLVFEYTRGDALDLSAAKSCTLAGSVVRRTGGRGLLLGGCHHGVEGCVFHDLGYDAIYAWGGNRVTLEKCGTVIRDNEIYDTGCIQCCYTPGIKALGCGIEIVNNHFHDIPSSALRIEGNDHLVESNLFERVVTESDDQGATDTFANPTYGGIVFRHNVFRDVGSPLGGRHCGSAGIRFDDAVSNMRVEGNRFENCSRGSFGAVQIHMGRYNLVTNNLMIGGRAGVSITDWNRYDPGKWSWYVNGKCEAEDGYFRQIDIHAEVWRTRYPWLQHPLETVCTNTIVANVVVGTKESSPILNATTHTADIANRVFATRPDEATLRAIPGFTLPPRAEDVGPAPAALRRARALDGI